MNVTYLVINIRNPVCFTNNTWSDTDENDGTGLLYVVSVLTTYGVFIFVVLARYVTKENQEWSKERETMEFINNIRLISMQEEKRRTTQSISIRLRNASVGAEMITTDQQNSLQQKNQNLIQDTTSV